ncbi:hypothetical protein [Luteimonas sp. J29]|jgi:hypothetical protein|uniref:hypothetical protein n=1 Tax=Luteimonas sp. J29 TaxID=935863 RepID=UPI0004B9804C|nr:hypothetical protein [Luteimonas sp. J29]
MAASAEILLVLALVALYLQDSAVLLHFDEVLVERAGRGWRVSTGSGFEARGRFLSLPNPLLPMRTRLRASWLHPSGAQVDTPADLVRFGRLLLPVRFGATVVGIVLLGVVPWLLLGPRDPVLLLAALCGTWLLVLAMAGWIALQRAALGLPLRKVLALALEGLLCPPHAINLYRRLCALRGFRGDPLAFAAAHLDDAARRRLRAEVASRLDLFALADDASGGRSARLAEARARAGDLLR